MLGDLLILFKIEKLLYKGESPITNKEIMRIIV